MNQVLANGNMKSFDNIESLLDAELSDIADLADFKVPALGRYKLSLSVETKEINGNAAVVFNYEVLEVIEMTNADDTPPTIGDKFGEQFTIANEFGVGKLKKSLKPYADHFGVSKIGELLPMLDGVLIDGTVKRREDAAKLDDDGKPRVYGSVVNVTVN